MTAKKIENGLIPFYGIEIPTAWVDGVAFVAMKPIVEAMGLSWASQTEKLKKDKRFDIETVGFLGKDQRTREMLSLTAEHLHGWLYSINPNKVREDLRETIITFQKETFKVINDYWNKGYAVNEKKIKQSYAGRIAGLTFGLKSKDKKIARLEEEIRLLKSQRADQKLIPDKTIDDKMQILAKMVDDSIKNNSWDWSYMQERAKTLSLYVKYIQANGTEQQKFMLQEIEKYKDKYVKASNQHQEEKFKREKLKNIIDQYVLISNQMLKYRFEE
jgi:hypothetical protein